MTEPIQVYDGDGLVVLDPKELYDQQWQVDIRLIHSCDDMSGLVVNLTRPDPETAAKLHQIKEYLQKAETLRANVTINGEDWNEMCITSVRLGEPALWVVRAVQ